MMLFRYLTKGLRRATDARTSVSDLNYVSQQRIKVSPVADGYVLVR